MNRCALAGAAVLLIAGCAASSPNASTEGAIGGWVLSAPSCPVEQARSPCPPRPVVGAIVVALHGGDVVASTKTVGGGRFQLDLPDGSYLIRATNVGGYASTAQRRVTVDGNVGPAHLIRLVVDSGIR